MSRADGAGPAILAFDTALAHVAAAVLADGAITQHHEAMSRGQAERLMPVLQDVLKRAGRQLDAIDAIGVGIGPGNFTGIRISVAAARGLALGLGVPAIGVSLFETLIQPAPDDDGDAVLVSLEAPRGQAYVQAFRGHAALHPPQLIDPARPPAGLAAMSLTEVRGFCAGQIAGALGLRGHDIGPSDIAPRIARIAARRMAQPGFDPALRPAPLYVRPADASPPREAPPVILT